MQAPYQKAVVVGLLIIPAQADQEFLSLDHQKGGFILRHCPKSRESMLVVSDWKYYLIIIGKYKQKDCDRRCGR